MIVPPGTRLWRGCVVASVPESSIRFAMRHLLQLQPAGHSRVRSVALACALALAVSGCGKAVTASPAPGAMALVQGDNQQVQGGAELPNPIVVRVLGTDGAPVADFPVGFIVARGGGTVSPGSALTDENGEVKTKWTLGPSEVQQMLRASAGALEPLIIAAIAVLPSDLIIAQGSNQSAKAGAALPNGVVVRVIGANNLPMKGITVAFQVTSGGGLITPASAVTNAAGEVLARWTLGTVAGTNSLSVVAGSLQPVLVLATGT